MIRLVTGPPGAGKTTYVKSHAKPADAIIDLDLLRDFAGGDATIAARIRAAMEKQMGKSARDVWVVRTLIDPRDREHFIRRHNVAEVIEVRASRETLVERARLRNSPPDVYSAIDKWLQLNPGTGLSGSEER